MAMKQWNISRFVYEGKLNAYSEKNKFQILHNQNYSKYENLVKILAQSRENHNKFFAIWYS